MVRYYREKETGDFMQVWWEHYFRTPDGKPTARASALAGLPSSVCTTNVAVSFIREDCEPVRKADVPPAWLAAF